MPLNEQQIEALLCAIKAYDYPVELHNFEKDTKIPLRSMRELEAFLRKGLFSKDTEELKLALANIVYWGNINSGYCSFRVAKFLNEITENKLEEAIDLFANISGDSLAAIKNIRLPQFSNMSFVSKLRMFLDPENFVTLDRKLLKIKRSGVHTLFSNICEQGTYIPINSQNCKQYVLWSQKCRDAASTYFRIKEVIAVDIERGIFKMVDKGEINEASVIVANM
jgi:hypothetical protein